MKWKKWLENWNMTSLKINAHFLEMEWKPNEPDKDAAWEMYVELITRITTQSLSEEDGNEQAALESIYSLFPLTRDILKKYGRDAQEFAKLAIVVLNQIIRPFTTKWHKLALNGAFENEEQRKEFRKELEDLQNKLAIYTKMLADMAGVGDLNDFEER
ncbi:hypothetical protein [Persephonella sp. KM09-Lau-8]|uniref:hypothetical protein n=1 Tax=Persephonella sp. KM09-Lau-8 TaxID=1158345 RepID=UPI0004966674|nr:hypothetical protein [Persephonella sp. KM09-Lau-8]